MVSKKKKGDFILTFKNKNKRKKDKLLKQIEKVTIYKAEKKRQKRNERLTDETKEFLDNLKGIDPYNFKKKLEASENKMTRKKKELDRDSYEFYEKRFNTELKAMYKMVEENQKIEQDLMELATNLKKSKNIRSYTEVMNTLIGLRKLRMDAFKENSSIKRVISDLEQKQRKFKADTGIGIEKSDDEFMLKTFAKLQEMSMGNTSSTTDFADDHNISNSMFDDDISSVQIEQKISQLEKQGDIKFSEHERNLDFSDRVIKEIIVKNDDEEDEWKIVAIDQGTGETVPGYYVTPKENLGRVKFDENENVAEDGIGRKYELLIVDSLVYNSY